MKTFVIPRECPCCGYTYVDTKRVCNAEYTQGLFNKNNQLQAENKRLKEALEKYGIHSGDCEITRQPFLSAANSQWECDCGFEQALKGE